jgi:hypothetical protein
MVALVCDQGELKFAYFCSFALCLTGQETQTKDIYGGMELVQQPYIEFH